MNWQERIAEAETRGQFTSQDNKLARYWHTCAVGEIFLPKKISFDFIKTHPKLTDLGGDFLGAVLGNKIDAAKAIHKKIQGAKS